MEIWDISWLLWTLSLVYFKCQLKNLSVRGRKTDSEMKKNITLHDFSRVFADCREKSQLWGKSVTDEIQTQRWNEVWPGCNWRWAWCCGIFGYCSSLIFSSLGSCGNPFGKEISSVWCMESHCFLCHRVFFTKIPDHKPSCWVWTCPKRILSSLWSWDVFIKEAWWFRQRRSGAVKSCQIENQLSSL